MTRAKNVNAEADIPKILGSRLKGNEAFVTVNTRVVPPPISIDQKAANGERCLKKNAATTGTSNPETIKA